MQRILVIDDDPVCAEYIRTVLTGVGYVVDVAVDGEEGRRRDVTGSYDLVVTDIFMPEGEGLGTIMALRKGQPSRKILAISGGGSQVRGLDVLTMARSLGADEVMNKPFRPQDLRETVARLVEARA